MTHTDPRSMRGKARREQRRPPSLAYWLIMKNEHNRMEFLTIDEDQVLPVFSREEEAEMFLQRRDVGDRWRVGGIGAGGLISVLYGPCAEVQQVVLDPPPRATAVGTTGSAAFLRERFMERIMPAERPVALSADRVRGNLRVKARTNRLTGRAGWSR